MLELHGIKKNFGDLEVLKGIDLTVAQGDVVAILGPSGSGKTTLLRCINFLERASGGEMVFDGERFDLSRISKKDIARLRQKTAFGIFRPMISPSVTFCRAVLLRNRL